MEQQELVLRARAGDREAIARIVSDEQRVVRGYLARLAPDPTTADDLAQEVFLAAFRAFDRIDPQQGLRGYLLGIARNLARAAWRIQDRRHEVGGEAVFAALEARVDGEASEDDSRLSALRHCLERLSPRALEIMRQHYQEELGCDEIAARINMVASSVRSVLTRSRAALRDCVLAATGTSS